MLRDNLVSDDLKRLIIIELYGIDPFSIDSTIVKSFNSSKRTSRLRPFLDRNPKRVKSYEEVANLINKTIFFSDTKNSTSTLMVKTEDIIRIEQETLRELAKR